MKAIRSLLVALFLLGGSRAWATPSEEAFDRLYGERVKKVLATPTKSDDLLLARDLYNDADGLGADPSLQVLLYLKAVEFGISDPGGDATVDGAVQQLAKVSPGNEPEIYIRLASLLKRQFASASRTRRIGLANRYLTILLQAIDFEAAAGRTTEASALCDDARSVASIAKPDQSSLVRAKVSWVAARQRAGKRMIELIAILKDKPDDHASAHELVQLLVLQFDNPRKAFDYLNAADDKTLNSVVPLAMKKEEELSEAEAVFLGDWYHAQANDAEDAGRQTAIQRSIGCYRRFLAEHASEDLQSLKVKLAVRDMERQSAKESGWTDLLSLVNVRDDIVAGTWHAENDGSVSSRADGSRGISRLRLPISARGSYELYVRFIRAMGIDDVSVFLPVGKGSVNLLLSGWGGTRSGLRSIAGRDCDGNEAVVGSAAGLENLREYTLGIAVGLHETDADIFVNIDGKPYIHWKGRQADLGVPAGAGLPDPKLFGLGAVNSTVTFQVVRIRALSGDLIPLKR